MSRIGKQPVAIPEGVIVEKNDNNIIVKNSKGELKVIFDSNIDVEIKDGKVIVTRKNELKKTKSLHGTIRNLIKNSIEGLVSGYSKTLELVGTGYRATMQGKNISLSLGFSHPVIIEEIKGIEFKVQDQTKIIISGIDKQLVGQIAANIRKIRPPEPYKGKGIKYSDEVIIKKQGKTASKGE